MIFLKKKFCAYKIKTPLAFFFICTFLLGNISICAASTVHIPASSGDGPCTINNSDTWSGVHTGATATACGPTDNSTGIEVDLTSGKYEIIRGFFPFNLAATTCESLTSARLCFWLYNPSGSPILGVIGSNQSSLTTLSNSDYGISDFTLMSEQIGSGDFVGSDFTCFELTEAGLSNIHIGGTAKFALLESHDYLDSAPTEGQDFYARAYLSESPTGHIPYLELTCGETPPSPPAEAPTSTSALLNMIGQQNNDILLFQIFAAAFLIFFFTIIFLWLRQ